MKIKQTKRCSKCHQEKPLDSFHKHRLGKYGRQGYCKKCSKSYQKCYQAIYRYTEAGKVVLKKGQAKFRNKNPNQHKAHNAIYTDIRSGRIKPAMHWKCINCGQQAKEYHHHKGYSPKNWHNVVPVCKICHHILNVG